MPKTSSKKFRQKIRDIKVWIYANRDQSLKKLMGMLNLKLVGHYRYYGISFNGRMISNYKQQVRELLFKVLNRRSDRKSYTREGFIEMLKYYPLVMPKIYVSLFWNCKYYYEEPYAGKPHVRFCEGLTLRGVSLLDLRWYRMKHECKITVLETKIFPDLQEKYLADPKSGPCPCFKVWRYISFEKDTATGWFLSSYEWKILWRSMGCY